MAYITSSLRGTASEINRGQHVLLFRSTLNALGRIGNGPEAAVRDFRAAGPASAVTSLFNSFDCRFNLVEGIVSADHSDWHRGPVRGSFAEKDKSFPTDGQNVTGEHLGLGDSATIYVNREVIP